MQAVSTAELVEKAALAAGGQRALAAMLNETEGNVSAWKSGKRPCGPKKRAAMASIAGYDPTRVLIESFANDLDESDATQNGARNALLAILAAFPEEKDEAMKVKSKSKKVNKAWLSDHLNDPYVKRAQQDGYRARAAYKLKEIDETLGLIKPGQRVVDLGATPGAWSQYLRRRMAPQGAAVGQLDGTIVALDILPMEPIEGVQFLLGDFREDVVLAQLAGALGGQALDVVVSDMAPNLSGVESSDAARIAHLVELAVEFAGQHLKPEGALVVKLFHGSGYSQLVKLFKERFRVVKPIKPKASRARSAETFLVGIGPK